MHSFALIWLAGLGGCVNHGEEGGEKVPGTIDPTDADTDTDTDTDSDTDSDTDTDTDADVTELVLELGGTDAEPEEDLSVTAEVRVNGVATGDEVALSVTPSGATLASDGGSVQAAFDGIYTVTATFGSMTESAAFTVDHNGPLLTVDGPEAASWVSAGSSTVEASATDNLHGVGDLSLDGTVVGGGATMSAPTAFSEGVNVVTVSGVDTDPHGGANEADVSIGVIAGVTSSLSTVLNDSLEARVSAAALNALAGSALSALDASTLESTLEASNPIVETSFSCVSIDVNVTSLSFDTATMVLTPSSAGVDVQVDIPNFNLGFTTSADVCSGGTLSYPGTITADNVEIASSLTFAVPTPGDVEVTSSDPTVTFTDFVADFGNLDDTLAAFGTSLEELGLDVEPLLADAFADAIGDEVPNALERVLEAVSITQTFDLMGSEVTLTAVIEDIETDVGGLTLLLQSNVTKDSASSLVRENPGSLLLTGDPPDYASSTADLSIALSLDLMNRILHQAWESGVLNIAYSDLTDATVIAGLGLFYDGLTSVDLTLSPLFPPVLTPGDGTAPFYLSIGELGVSLDGTVDGVDQHLTDLRLFVTADMAMEIVDGELSLAAEDTDIIADAIVLDANGVDDAERLESVVAIAASGMLTDLLPNVSFALPTVEGLEMSDASVDAAGSAGTWIAVSGSLD